MGSTAARVAAFVLGCAVGLLNNTVSRLAWRLGKKGAGLGASPPVNWPALFALQYFLRLALSVVSLYVVFRVSAADPVAILANLAGLLLARYLLVWRLARERPGGAA